MHIFSNEYTTNFMDATILAYFNYVWEEIKKRDKQFILLSSGRAAEKIFDYCSDIEQIREYYIFWFNKGDYIPLLKKYKKLKGV